MDDSDVERIVESSESRYGKSRIEFASRNKSYRGILLDDYIYGGKEKREERLAEGKRIHVSEKQDDKIKIGLKAYVRYGKVSRQGMNAIRALIRKGKVESN
jgi:hypothetical protein